MANDDDKTPKLYDTTPKPKQFCRIVIMFPMDDDETAIVVRRGVTALLADIPNAQTTFFIANLPGGNMPPLTPG